MRTAGGMLVAAFRARAIRSSRQEQRARTHLSPRLEYRHANGSVRMMPPESWQCLDVLEAYHFDAAGTALDGYYPLRADLKVRHGYHRVPSHPTPHPSHPHVRPECYRVQPSPPPTENQFLLSLEYTLTLETSCDVSRAVVVGRSCVPDLWRAAAAAAVAAHLLLPRSLCTSHASRCRTGCTHNACTPSGR